MTKSVALITAILFALTITATPALAGDAKKKAAITAGKKVGGKILKRVFLPVLVVSLVIDAATLAHAVMKEDEKPKEVSAPYAEQRKEHSITITEEMKVPARPQKNVDQFKN